MIRIFLVEDHLLMRQGLATSLERVDDLCVSGEAESGEAALSTLLSLPPDSLPDVVIMDIGLPGLSGIETTRRLKESRPDLRVLMFTVHHLEREIFAAFSSGADGYCLKDSDIDSLLLGIRSVFLGSLYVDPRIAHLAIRRILAFPDSSGESPLTPRETDVLRALADGQSNREIAQTLDVILSTVKAHIRSILQKLSASTRADAAVKALKKGWL